ncbi:nickel pincer cofactor biosynthesis protein LarC [Nocardioides pocheonensis]|uniref:Pyridinium-3,5-bisthiocarboxylic acid mononucleotide nickel insertion protein n=2 Tax=Nocardioides pocheonensis TaxID=661485 RepID=A0A3N0GK23_9ACTN|nr:nickel pincer cofactor biosynthesis protein LarC [Nocardioides pocheonensis]
MLLGALVDAGVPLEVIRDAVDAVTPEPVELRAEPATRNGFAATRCLVRVADSATERSWADVRRLVEDSSLDPAVLDVALEVFGRIAEAEAAVHGVAVDDVHFHEVGALDSIADVVGVAAGFVHLGLDWLVCSPVALGGGTVRIAHGAVGVPAPAVVELLRGLPSYGGPVDLELTTPTGAALLAVLADEFGPQPPMAVDTVGVGAGGRDPAGHANVVRLVVGEAVDTDANPAAEQRTEEALVIEANVDDLDPRLWPDVIAALLDAGASDAWLTPILMKKGRPAHTLHVLVAADADAADAVRREVFRQTSTIGVREQTFAKVALDREFVAVEVDGHRVAVKLARLDGELMNVQPEYADVRAAARATGRPVKDVLAEAAAHAREATS